ncbi:hypothetical protein AMTR_s05347p00001480, partial [Amborella trichopoda]
VILKIASISLESEIRWQTIVVAIGEELGVGGGKGRAVCPVKITSVSDRAHDGGPEAVAS